MTADTMPPTYARNAPVRFRGPARIALNSKFVPADPFGGDDEISQWSIGDVYVWVKSLEGGVSQYADAFLKNHIKGQDLIQLTEAELEYNLHIVSVGHRKLLMQSIQELKNCVIAEISDSRYLLPPYGVVLRFEDVCVHRRALSSTDKPLDPVLTHLTGTFLPTQITCVIGSEHKSAMLRVLAGYDVSPDYIVSGLIFLNGSTVSGSLVTASLASFISHQVLTNNIHIKRTHAVSLNFKQHSCWLQKTLALLLKFHKSHCLRFGRVACLLVRAQAPQDTLFIFKKKKK
ncbi:hypothetical protein RFI_20867 [Reticulomyxa filosa]|uniref:SAM domain-containing protein n=1 Tax=Reticulomyxa filosa TaxID=46433 RepID=X6MR56_RETFI|nr:hypothetical protein RFI_20867 [Reticulomyxa filosa]|eukprot:ETO16473.1 hypothetical protein RFI_20867 [Reticulomyxa filosa]